MKLLHLTDLHLTSRPEEVFGLDTSARLRKCLAHIEQYHRDANALIVTGDLTHNGDRAGYEALRDVLVEASCPVHLLLGNHDHRETFLSVFPDAPVVDGFVQHSAIIGNLRCLILDTLVDGEGYGTLCETRLAWLRAKVAEPFEGRTILFMHHPPCPEGLGVPGFRTIAFQNVEAFFDAIRSLGAPQIFAGHYHLPIQTILGGCPVTVGRGVAHQIVLDLQGNYKPDFIDARPSYNVLLVNPGNVIVHTWDFLDEERIVRPRELRAS